MPSKLELEMGRREAQDKAVGAASRKAEEAKAKQQRQKRLFERKEFNRLFKKLRGMVEGHWNRYGHGWKFKYKGGDFYIDYEHYRIEKTFGDAEDYATEGDNWVLKLGFNGIQGRTINLSYDYKPKNDLTDEVMNGIRELARKFANDKGRFYGEEGEGEDD